MADTNTTPTCKKCRKEVSEADWTECDRCDNHKKACAKNRNNRPPPQATPRGRGGTAKWSPSELTPGQGLDQPVHGAFTKLGQGTFLHDRPEVDVYRILIDTYRLRMEDTFNLDRVATPKSLYCNGVTDATEGFREFLARVGRMRSLLPTWWNSEKQAECETLSQKDEHKWYSLKNKVSKADIIQHYRDDHFPMQLRMLGEAIYGIGPGGSDGTIMRQTLADMEAGTSRFERVAHIDASR
ncbi:MYND finger [Colletotrichum zoysiae]|uniref:MYND finger n=1 Tax=Colletotrichum zoysiae TaxID=1216348 RepID=A0AAD9HL49_9PEZI|nr:MYND finger [Colletotrichum zoysiae]